jgi:hypothetical protein
MARVPGQAILGRPPAQARWVFLTSKLMPNPLMVRVPGQRYAPVGLLRRRLASAKINPVKIS